MTEHTETETRAGVSKSAVRKHQRQPERAPTERLVICLRYGWRFRPMMRSWWRETKALGVLAWFVPVSIFAFAMQIFAVVIYPINHLIYQPVKVALFGDSGLVGNLEKMLRNR